MTAIFKLVGILTPKEKRNAFFLVLIIFLMALIDALGVASIMPFMAALASPQTIQENSMLAQAYQYLNFSDINSFLFFLGLLTLILLIGGQTFRAFVLYRQVKFAMMCEYAISKRLLDCYLNQPYEWLLNRNSSELGRTLLSEIGTVIGGGLMPLISLITQCALTVTLIILLIIVDPILAALIGGVLGGIYLAVYIVSRRFITRIGIERNKANQGRFSVVSEAFGAFREAKMFGLESVFVDRFSISAEIYAQHQLSSTVVSQLPRYVLEATAYGGIMMLLLGLMSDDEGGLAKVLPVVSLYAFSGYRLLPALQQIYSSLSQLRFIGPALEIVSDDLVNLKNDKYVRDEVTPINIKESIQLNNVWFRYSGSSSTLLKNFNFKVQAYKTIGIVGPTGGGKSTIINIILGLLEPQKGELTVDGLKVNRKNRWIWQQSIGYVPQQIYLSDDSIAANIAFGVDSSIIDQEALIRASKAANLHEFIIKELSNGYNTMIGERGVRLSGGQRQRIGIARALYRSPQVLIFDEATSALDGVTENAVMEAVTNLKNKITIIIVAHRLTTLRKSDEIFIIDKGQIVAHGAYDELSKSNQKFKEMLGK